MTNRRIDWNFNGYKKEAHFFLCGAFESFAFLQVFLKTVKECPKMMKDNVVIDSVFGSPTCVWNGGRALADVYYDRKQLQSIHDTYANLDVKVRFIFTNPFLNEHDLYDRYCNLVMSIFQDMSPEIVVNSPLLEEYLRNNYPAASFVSSTTKRLRSSEAQLNEFSHDYKYVCLDYDYNYNFEFLDSIPQRERDRVEILINSTCPRGCNARVLHQEFSAKRQLEFNSDDDCESERFYGECPKIKRIMQASSLLDDTTKNIYIGTNYIFPQDLDNYLDKGYSHFKIQGRELKTSQLFAEFLPYIVRPDFYPMAISILNSDKWG